MKNILKTTFWQLIFIYALFIGAIALGYLWEFSFQFHIFAIVIAVFGITLISKEEKLENSEKPINKKLHYTLFIFALLLIFVFRMIPYINNTIPLGYDAGIYKYAIENGLDKNDSWIISQITMEPAFLYSFHLLNSILSSQFMLTWLFILLFVILGIAIYLIVKEFSDSRTALITVFVYAFSIVQFKVFSYCYYRNLLGMILILFSLLLLKRYEKTQNRKHLIWFILLGGLIGAVHRASFYIFGLSYFFYAFISPFSFEKRRYDLKKLAIKIMAGIIIILLALLFYIGDFWPAFTNMFFPVIQSFIQPGEASGTFITFLDYQFSSLFYLPLAFLGLFYFLRKKEFNILIIWAVINLAIVYFQFFFFNRLIIFLDLVLIILAGKGISIMLEDKKKIGIIILCILLLSAGTLTYKEAQNSKSLINEQELSMIKQFTNTPQESFVMSTSSYYSPWILGYSERKTIAPGLFDYDVHSHGEWNNFWTTNNLTEINGFLGAYEKPLYIFIGERQKNNIQQFNDSACFKIFTEDTKDGRNKIYESTC
jgi:hypothetical protein